MAMEKDLRGEVFWEDSTRAESAQTGWKRAAGVLLPIFSLPGRYGIGGFGEEAFRFADFLSESGQSYWQILPLGPTGYGDSPYQSFSTFAGNPYFIDLPTLIREGLLTEEECEEAGLEEGAEEREGEKEDGSGELSEPERRISYERQYRFRYPLLRKAYARFQRGLCGEESWEAEREFYQEFLQEEDIQEKYGRAGIQSYDLDPATGKALISDDTQMTMFTANGVLVGQTQRAMRGTKAALSSYVELAYQDWFKTQTESMEERKTWKSSISWLLDVPGLYARRAPGNTCLSALSQGITGSEYIRQAKNHSKGCGGLIRVAPLALACRPDRGDFKGIETLDREGAQIAAITHGHSLGYMPAAVLTHILSQILTHPQADLKSIVLEAREMVQKLFPEDAHLPELVGIMDLALELSANDKPDVENIHALGEGWEAEETLGIALYCALKYEKDFSAGIIAAVNHNGDSDSTGSVTGNILGALLGYERMETKWKEHLELSEVILELADDLCHGCQMSEHGHYADPVWMEKYRNMHRYTFLGYDKYVFFWKAKEEYGEFSNWYSSPFVFEDFEYQHLEQYMMARKAKLFHDAKRYTRILRADSPRECKDLGREVAGFSEDIWNEEKFEIVKEGLREKFTQNPGLLKKLLATGERILVEASPLDRIWGIGLDEKNAKRTPPQDWPGENLLGKALMELRRELENGK